MAHTGPRTSAGMGEGESPFFRVVVVAVLYNLELFGRAGNGTHSSTLAWKIPWTEEPGRLQSMGSLRVRHN